VTSTLMVWRFPLCECLWTMFPIALSFWSGQL
jgi:hypothetical protein